MPPRPLDELNHLCPSAALAEEGGQLVVREAPRDRGDLLVQLAEDACRFRVPGIVSFREPVHVVQDTAQGKTL